MTQPDSRINANPGKGAPDGDVNRDHRGAPAYENSGPGTPGNVDGAADGKGGEASPTTEEASEQSTVSSPAPGSGA